MKAYIFASSSLSESLPGSAAFCASSSPNSSGNAAISATRPGPLTGAPAALQRVRTRCIRASGVACVPDLEAASSSFLRAEMILRSATASCK